MSRSTSQSTKNVSRRSFLANSAAAGAAAWGLGSSLRAHAADTADIRVAVVGISGRGRRHIEGVQNNLVALVDCDEKILAERAQQFQDTQGKKLDTFVDYRRMLERDDIDAVTIATPNHTHALIAIAAIQAGKQVYVEKPVSHNIWEGRQIVHAARKYNCIVQCGTQSRSSQALKEAVAFVQCGNLGEIKYALGTCYKPRKPIGKLDSPLQIPKHIDYDLWCGPAEKRDLFRSQLHYDWHWDFNTGNGDTGNQGIHQMDIARWFLGEDALAPQVISIGGRVGYDDAGDTPNSQIVLHNYKKAPLLFETRGLPRSKAAQADWGNSMDRYRGMQIGVIVQCENGYVTSAQNYDSAKAYDHEGQLIKQWDGPAGQHFENWLAAVGANNGSLLNADVLEGHVSSALCHVGGVSHRLGTTATASEIAERIVGNDMLSSSFERMAGHLRANGVNIDSGDQLLSMGATLEIDPAAEQFVGNDAANELVTRNYRRPFVVPNMA